jgi:menaquinone-dependent protoporphyrinogen oxidase
MANVLIVFGTKEGHTTTIVERMREAMEAQGHVVGVEHLEASNPPPAIPDDVQGLVVGGPIHKGEHLAEVRAFAKANGDGLERTPSAFFQVCLAAADPTPEAQTEIGKIRDSFLAETGWRPERAETFAGMLAWTQYDFFTRLLMKLIVRKHTSPEERDTSRDVDYTDYDAVRRFAVEFADSLDAR